MLFFWAHQIEFAFGEECKLDELTLMWPDKTVLVLNDVRVHRCDISEPQWQEVAQNGSADHIADFRWVKIGECSSGGKPVNVPAGKGGMLASANEVKPGVCHYTYIGTPWPAVPFPFQAVGAVKQSAQITDVSSSTFKVLSNTCKGYCGMPYVTSKGVLGMHRDDKKGEKVNGAFILGRVHFLVSQPALLQ